MKLLIDDLPLQVLPNLAKAIGLNEAIFLQQLHYWLNRSVHTFDGRQWVYNTASGWADQFPFWSEKTIRRTINKLKKQNLIDTTNRFNKKNYDKTNWFTINYQSMEDLDAQIQAKASGQSDHSVTKASGQSDQIHVDNLTRPIPETTRDYKTPAAKKTLPVPQSKTDHAWFTAWWCYSFRQITRTKYAYTKKDAAQVKKLLLLLGLEETVARACVYLSLPDRARFPRGAPTIGGLLFQINEVTSFDRDIEDKFVAAELLPDLDQLEKLIDFQPWKEVIREPELATA